MDVPLPPSICSTYGATSRAARGNSCAFCKPCFDGHENPEHVINLIGGGFGAVSGVHTYAKPSQQVFVAPTAFSALLLKSQLCSYVADDDNSQSNLQIRNSCEPCGKTLT